MNRIHNYKLGTADQASTYIMETTSKTSVHSRFAQAKARANAGIKYATNVKGDDLMIGGGITIASAYVGVGVAVLLDSVLIYKIAVASFYIGLGTVVIGGIKYIVDHDKKTVSKA